MAKICPECGREFSSLSQSVKCPICKCTLVGDGGFDNSEAARRERLKQLQKRPQTQIQEVQLEAEPIEYVEPVQNGVSALGIIALIFSLLGCLSFVGTILAIIDLCIKDGKKKVCSIIALAVTCLWCVVAVFAVLSSDTNPKSVRNTIGNRVSEQKQQETGRNQTAPSKDTFGLMETAEMNNVKVTMTNYNESNGSEWNSPSEGNVFVLIEFEIENNSDSDVAVSSVMSFNAYIDNYSASLSLGALMENNSTQLDGSIAPGMKMRGWIGYEAPTDWKNIEIHFTDNVWNNNKFEFLIQK